MASRGTTKQFSSGMGRGPGKLLLMLTTEYQFPGISPHTEEKMFNCSLRTHEIYVLLYDILYDYEFLYKIF